MKIINTISPYFYALLLVIKTSVVLSTTPQLKDEENKLADSDKYQIVPNGMNTQKNPDLETIILSPKIRIIQHKKKSELNSNELIPFIQGSNQIR